MLDVDTFLTELYVMVDDLRQCGTPQHRPGPQPSLSGSEVITLAIFGRWSRFSSERDFYRYAESHLRGAFPTLPERSQFSRLVRLYADDIEEVAVKLAQVAERGEPPYQSLDASAMPIRDAKRRGPGWLAGAADIGWSNSIGWYEGFSVLSAVSPSGVITGFCFAPASTADQPLAETFFAVRAYPNPRLPSVGEAACVPYVADKGFEGAENHRHWLCDYGAEVSGSKEDKPGERTSAKKKARQLAKHLRGERPDYAYLKQVFRHLRDELEIDPDRAPKNLPYVPTEEEIRSFYETVWKARRTQDMGLPRMSGRFPLKPPPPPPV